MRESMLKKPVKISVTATVNAASGRDRSSKQVYTTLRQRGGEAHAAARDHPQANVHHDARLYPAPSTGGRDARRAREPSTARAS